MRDLYYKNKKVLLVKEKDSSYFDLLLCHLRNEIC